MPGFEFPDDRGIGDLLGPVDPEYIYALSVKWQLPETWQAGDMVPSPLDLLSFADQLGLSPEQARVLDDKMTRTFRDAIGHQPAALLPVEFAAQPIDEATEWWWRNYGLG